MRYLTQIIITLAMITLSSYTYSQCGGPVPNLAPMPQAQSSSADAYSSQVIELSGAASSDVDGQIVQYQWSQLLGPTVVLIQSSPTASFVAPPVGEPTTLRFRLVVTDDDDATASVDIDLEVRPADVQLAIELVGDVRFAVDDEQISIAVASATFQGSDVVPVAVKATCGIDGLERATGAGNEGGNV